MEEFKCLNCGEEMDYIGKVNNEIEFSTIDGKMWIVAKWECLECGKVEKVEFVGKMIETCRNA